MVKGSQKKRQPRLILLIRDLDEDKRSYAVFKFHNLQKENMSKTPILSIKNAPRRLLLSELCRGRSTILRQLE
jgi:hypothetical protein